MPSKNESLVNSKQESYPGKPSAYSVYFEVRLKEQDYGKKRNEHNTICNQQLLAHLEGLSAEGIELYETVSNAQLVKKIIENPQESPHTTLTWHHCHSKTVEGALGVMHLVPKAQHNNKAFSNVFHISKKGGYDEWAVPNGAPVDKPKNHPPTISEKTIQTLSIDALAPALLVAIRTNNDKKFNLVLERARELKLSEDALTTLITQNYQIGLRKKSTNLLHLATHHSNMAIINPLLNYFTKLPNFSQLADSKGNTAAHIAAKKNRDIALKELIQRGIDLTIKNKKQLTAYNIAQTLNHTECLDYCKPEIHEEQSEQNGNPEKKPEFLTNAIRDPQFVYGNKANRPPSAFLSTLSSASPAQPTASEKSSASYHEEFLDRIRLVLGGGEDGAKLLAQQAEETKQEKLRAEAKLRLKPQQKPTASEKSSASYHEEFLDRIRLVLGGGEDGAKLLAQQAEETKQEKLRAEDKLRLKLQQKPSASEKSAASYHEEFLDRIRLVLGGGESGAKLLAQQAEETKQEKLRAEAKSRLKPQQKPTASEKSAASSQKEFLDRIRLVIGRGENGAKLLVQQAEEIKHQKKTYQQQIKFFKPNNPQSINTINKFHNNLRTPTPQTKEQENSIQVKNKLRQQVQQGAQEKTHREKQLAQQQVQRASQQEQQKNQQPYKSDQKAQQSSNPPTQQKLKQPAQQKTNQQAIQKVQPIQPQMQQQKQEKIQQRAQQQQQTQQRGQQQQAQQKAQQRGQQQAQQRAQQRGQQQQAQQQIQQRAQQQAQQRAQQQAQQRAQQQAQQQTQQRAQQQAQQRAQQQAQQRAQQQAQQRAQQRAQQQAQQRAQQQAQQRAQQQAQQRAQQQAQQRAQQQAQQRAQQQAQQQAQQRTHQQAQQRVQRQAQLRAQQQAQQRAQQLAQQQAQQQAQQRAQQQAQQRVQQQAVQRAYQPNAAQQRAAQQAQQQIAQQIASQRAYAQRAAAQAAASQRAAQQVAAQRSAQRPPARRY